MKLKIRENNEFREESGIIDFIEIKFKDGRSQQIDTSNLEDALDSLNKFLKTNRKSCDSKFSRKSLNLPKD